MPQVDRALILPISQLEIWNDGTGTHEIGNYDYKLVLDNKIKRGHVEGFAREENGELGHLMLLRKVLAEVFKNEALP